MPPFQDFLTGYTNAVLTALELNLAGEEEQNLRATIEEFAQRRILSALLAYMPDDLYDDLTAKIMSGALSEAEEMDLMARAFEKIPQAQEHIETALRRLYYELIHDANMIYER